MPIDHAHIIKRLYGVISEFRFRLLVFYLSEGFYYRYSRR